MTRLKPMTIDELRTEVYCRLGRHRPRTAGELFTGITGRSRIASGIERKLYADIGRALQMLKREHKVRYLSKAQGGPGWRLR